MLHAFKYLAKLKVLRGTPFDLFGYSHHRRAERALIADYEATIDELLAGLAAENCKLAAQIAALPEFIRGYDIVKERQMEQTRKRHEQLMAQFRSGETQMIHIAEVA